MSRFFRGLLKRPIAFVSFIVLIILYLMMIFAEFVAPYTPSKTFSDEYSNCPSNITFYSKKYGFCLQVQKRVLVDPITYKYVKIKGAYYKVKWFSKGEKYKMWGIFESDIHLLGIENDSNENNEEIPIFIFGSDNMSRDLFSRIVYGSRISLTIGFVGIFISLILAIIIGGLAGYYGGWVDWILMRICEFIILIPGLYLILFLRSIVSRNLDSGQAFVLITVILSFIGWPGSARLIRGMVHSIKREDFVINAQLESIPPLIIIFRYIIPQISSILIISITLGIPGFILGETVLSYLGLGIVDPSVSWGSLINRQIASISNIKSFPWYITPAIFLIITTLAFNFIGDLLRDIFDPYYRDKNIG